MNETHQRMFSGKESSQILHGFNAHMLIRVQDSLPPLPPLPPFLHVQQDFPNICRTTVAAVHSALLISLNPFPTVEYLGEFSDNYGTKII